MHIQHVRRLSFMINSIKEGQIEKEENIMKKALPLIMAALVAASLAGCGSTKTEATTAAPAETTTAAAAETTKEEAKAEETTEAPTEAKAEPITMNVAYMPNYGSLWSVMTAKEKGFFDEEGITVNLVEFADGPTIIAAMESGSIDVGYIGQALISFVSTARPRFLHCPIFPTATL